MIGTEVCVTGQLGVCALGHTVCTDGQLSCVADNEPAAVDTCGDGTTLDGGGSAVGRYLTGERCVGLDNDCDGVVDENCCSSDCSVPPDDCHSAGTCVAGQCEYPALADGTGCNDNNACTQTDTCVAGVCTGTNPVVCDSGACGFTECDTSSGACSITHYTSAGSVCRNSAGPCDVAESCTGASIDCPADGLVPAGLQCRASTGGCDPAEQCTGVSALCPPDELAPAGTVCRPSTGPCDPVEVCAGNSTQCPTDENDLCIFFEALTQTTFYRVPVAGAMTDANIRTACLARGLRVPCSGLGPLSCFSVPNTCTAVPAPVCTLPFFGLTVNLCGIELPGDCAALEGVFTFQTGVQGGAALGVFGGGWPVNGALITGQYALCF